MTILKNLETRRIELHFTKAEYSAFSESQKNELKLRFLWSRTGSCWVSKATNDHYWALRAAEKLGFDTSTIEEKGQRISFAEELAIKDEKAENRAERYTQYAQNAKKRGDSLQAELNSYRGDVAFFTQPIIAGHAGSQAFAKRRQRIYDRYDKGFEEYQKSDYFKARAASILNSTSCKNLSNPVYLNNRIEEGERNLRALERAIIKADETNNEYWLNDLFNKMERELDKLMFFKNAMAQLKETLKDTGKKLYTKDDIKVGYHIRTRYESWALVTRVNQKSVSAEFLDHPLKGFTVQPAYAEITDVKIPEDWNANNKKGASENNNPYTVGEILTLTYIMSKSIKKAFQVVKVTGSSVFLREIKVEDNKPLKDQFVSEKIERRAIKVSSGKAYVGYNDMRLYKYSA